MLFQSGISEGDKVQAVTLTIGNRIRDEILKEATPLSILKILQKSIKMGTPTYKSEEKIWQKR